MAKKLIPPHITPMDLAESMNASPRAVKDRVRELGCYRKIGQRVIMLDEDVAVFLEDCKPCQSKPTNGAKSGTIGAPQPVGDYAALQARRTKPLPKGSRQKKKPQRGDVILMAPTRL